MKREWWMRTTAVLLLLLGTGGCSTLDKMMAASVDDLKRVTQIGFDRLDMHDEHMTQATMALATSDEVRAEMTAFATAYAATTEEQDGKLDEIHSSVGNVLFGAEVVGLLGLGGVGGRVVAGRKKVVT